MPMSPRLLRPIASGVHPEAAAWRSAVVANGGSVSAATMRAVSKLCADIDRNGLRSKIRRLNPMAGGNLNAALVPLYKSTSATGSLIGNATDTNNNFVSGDYSESSGLVGNGTTKTLMTGVAQNYSAAKHLAVFAHTRESGFTYFRTLIGCADSVTPGVGQVGGFFVEARSPSGTPLPAFVSSPNDAFQQVLATGTSFNSGDFLIGTTTGSGANNGRIIVNGTVQATATGRDSSFSAATVGVFAMFRQSDSTYQGLTQARLGGYSIGDNLTDTEAATYSTIWDTFLKAMGRR